MELQSFGKYLVQQRELRGLSTEDVASATRISVSLIGALESGEVEKLPAQVFVTNYVRAYAKVIGLSPDETVLRLEEVYRVDGNGPTEGGLQQKRHLRGALVFGLLIFAAGLFLAGWLLFRRS